MANEITKTLTDEERERWEELNVKVQQGFLETGDALREIRERKLYRDEFNDWESYCLSIKEMTKTQANRLVRASKVCGDLEPIGSLPGRESHCRELWKLPEPEQRREAWQEVIEATGEEEVTAKTIRRVVRKKRKDLGLLPPPKSKAKSEDTEPDAIEVEAEVVSEEFVRGPKETFGLADGTKSEPVPWAGDIFPSDYFEAKLRSLAENNRNAPDHLREEDAVIVQRQRCLVGLAGKANELAGMSPDADKKGALYHAIEELKKMSISFMPVNPRPAAADDGKGE